MIKLVAAWSTSSFGAAFPEGIRVVPNPHGRRMTEDEAADFLSREKPVGLVAGVDPLRAAGVL